MATGPKGSWGGPRPGSGPKTQTLSAQAVRKLVSTAEAWAAKTGKHIDDILVGFIYDETLSCRDRTLAIKLVKEYTMAKLVEGSENDVALGPALYLPEERPDPANVIPIESAK